MEEENKKPWYLPNIPPITVTIGVGGTHERTFLGEVSPNEVTDELWITIDDESIGFIEAANMFSDSTLTEAIRCDYSTMDSRQFNGYTKLISVGTDYTNKIKVRLTRP